MIQYKTEEQIETMRESALVVSKTLGMLASEIKPGVTPIHLDKMAHDFIRDHDAIPGFLGLYNFPNSLCISKNEQVVHGIPDETPLEEGDIVSIDCGALKNGFYGDHAYTFEVGDVSEEKKRLCKVTKECLDLGIEQVRAGKRIGDIGFAIQRHAERNGYGVVRELVGHGLGKAMHEAPEVPNYGRKGKGTMLKNGIVLAIEPMINMGDKGIRQLSDGWTIITSDKKPSAHFEHDVALWKGEPIVLSTFDYIEEALGIKN